MTTAYISWTPDSGTHELPRVHRGTPLADLPTQEIPVPYLKPSPTHRGPSARLRSLVWFAAPLAAGALYVAQVGGLL